MNTHLFRIGKFITTGLVGISVNLGLLYTLASSLGVFYLTASVIAVSVSTVVGFVLQKYWTFEERTHARAGAQFALYVLIALMNITVNTGIVYVLVEWFGAHYLLAQFIGAGAVGLWSYFLYRHVLFRSQTVSGELNNLSVY